jgi:hypothetical protein
LVAVWLAALSLLPVAAPTPADALPAPFEANYEGSRFPFSASATIALQRMGDYFRFSMRGSVRAAFFKWTDIYDCSVLRLQDGQFFPVEYVHRDSREPERNALTRFDWTNRAMRTTRGDGAVQVLEDLPPVAWDLMSIQVRLRADVAGAARGAELVYPVIEKGHVRKRRLTVASVDEMQANEQTLKVVKAEANDGSHRHQFWFAPNYAWLPVRVSIGDVTLDLVSPPGEAARPASPASESPPTCER